VIIKIFKVGKYPQGRWDMERVRRLVDAYDPENGIEAPCVVGHDRGEAIEGELALGWVRSLELNEQGEVWANIDASERLRKWMATRKLGYVSAAILVDDEKDENKPPRLAHVAFLGRTNPQIASTRLPSLYTHTEKGVVAYRKIKIGRRAVKSSGKQRQKLFGDGGGSDEPKEEIKEEKMNSEREGRITELENEKRELDAQLKEAKKKNEEYTAREAETEILNRLDALIKDGKVAPSARAEFTKAALSASEEGRQALYTALDKSPRLIDGEEHFAKDGIRGTGSMSNQEIRAFAASKQIGFEVAVELLRSEGRIE